LLKSWITLSRVSLEIRGLHATKMARQSAAFGYLYWLSFGLIICGANKENNHADHYAEGFSERAAITWARRNASKRSSGHRCVVE
jgi:hypothetical protein